MRTVAVSIATLCWAIAAWCSRGTLSVIGSTAGAPRLGLLPPFGRLAVLAAVAIAIAWWLRTRQFRLAPLFLCAFALLPWLPGVPVPCLIWTGPATTLIWIAVFAGLLVAHDWRSPRWSSAGVARLVRDPSRAPLLAAAAAILLCGTAAWFVSPSVPGGDEPHYLVITQSLLHDFDLKIENNHQQRDYASYTRADLEPAYWRRGQDGEIYSIHMPGLPALVAPAFAIGGYRGVVFFLVIASALGTGLAWTLAHKVSGSIGGAWFGWAAVTLSATFVFHAFSIYPDGLGAIPTLAGVWALVRLGSLRDGGRPPTRALTLVGAMLALLPWLHQRFALLAGVLGVLILLRIVQYLRVRPALAAAAAFLAVPVASAIGWLGMFYLIYGEADPMAPYGGMAMSAQSGIGSWSFVASGLGGLLFDQQFGLLSYAPVLGLALLSLVAMIRDRDRRRLAIELILVMIPYLLAVTHFRMWWGGWSAPARFFAPLLLSLAVPAAVMWARTPPKATKATMVLAALLTAFITAALVLQADGRLAYNVRDGHALWLEWLSKVTDLPLGLPSFHRTSEGQAFWHVGLWLACLFGGWLVVRLLERAGMRHRATYAAVTPGVFAASAMIALALVWRANGVSGVAATPGQLELLRAAGELNVVAVGTAPLRLVDPSTVPAQLVLETVPRYLQSRDRPLFVLPGIPAGAYAIQVETRPGPSGTVWLGIAPDEVRLSEFALSSVGVGQVASIPASFPVNVRALVVRGDDAARAAVTRITVRPRTVVEAARRVSDATARRAMRYPAGTVYFFDDDAFAEPDAFWVRGASDTDVALETAGRPAAAGGREAALFLRNAPVGNRVIVEIDRWRETLSMQPGEERLLTVPLAAGKPATGVRLTTSAGFRPAEVNRASRDQRYLGVWVQVRE